MAELVVPPGFAQATFVLSQEGDPEPMNNVVGVEWSPVGNVQDTVEGLYVAYQDNFLPEMCADTHLLAVRVSIAQDGGGRLVFEYFFDADGDEAELPLPNNTAYLLQKRSEEGGRRGRGRMFVPGVPASDVTGAGVLASTRIAALTTRAAQFLSDLEDLGTPMVLFHSVAPFDPTPVILLTPAQKVATQRTRMRP